MKKFIIALVGLFISMVLIMPIGTAYAKNNTIFADNIYIEDTLGMLSTYEKNTLDSYGRMLSRDSNVYVLLYIGDKNYEENNSYLKQIYYDQLVKYQENNNNGQLVVMGYYKGDQKIWTYDEKGLLDESFLYNTNKELLKYLKSKKEIEGLEYIYKKAVKEVNSKGNYNIREIKKIENKFAYNKFSIFSMTTLFGTLIILTLFIGFRRNKDIDLY